MGIFNFWRKNPIDFADENIAVLNKRTDSLCQTLIDNGYGFYVDYLIKIRISAENKNEEKFRELVISRELFGGSGALWEINIDDSTEYEKFKGQFTEYIDLITFMGIKNGRVKQIQKIMPKLK
jgi:hypothetical protein